METKAKGRVRIVRDECPHESPRDWDGNATLIASHRRYDLGDKNTDLKVPFDELNGWDEVKAYIIKEAGPIAAILPVYLFNHSGLALSTTGFGAQDPQRWDWGQVGFIFTTKAAVRDWWGCKQVTKKIVERCENSMRSELETYEQYLNGEVYGFIAEKLTCEKCGTYEQEESCWGFYGSDWKTNGIEDHISDLIADGYIVTDEEGNEL